MTAAGRLRSALVFGLAGGVYLLTLTASTSFGLGLGLDEETGTGAAVQTGVSYRADIRAELGSAVLAPAGELHARRLMHYLPLTIPAAALPAVVEAPPTTTVGSPEAKKAKAPGSRPEAKQRKARAGQ